MTPQLPMTYAEFCEHVPLFQHPPVAPSTNATFLEFVVLNRRRGDYQEEHDTRYNLIRASCEYLEALQERPASLWQVNSFLRRPWGEVLGTLETYAPVTPLLAYTQALAADRDDSPFEDGRHANYVINEAAQCVGDCLAFLNAERRRQAQQRQDEAEEQAWQQQQLEREAQWKKMARQELIARLLVGVIVFITGVVVGVAWAGKLPPG